MDWVFQLRTKNWWKLMSFVNNVALWLLLLNACFCCSLRRHGLCDPREYYDDVYEEPEHYMQCTPKIKQVGEWEELECPLGHRFVKKLQKCIRKEAMKRQYIDVQAQCEDSDCLSRQTNTCQDASMNPIVGDQCSWTTASLQPDPTSHNFFLQCTPSTQGADCGTWQRMACTPDSFFNPQLQVCVTQNLQGACQPNYQPVVPCAYQNACPSTCLCYIGVCCQPNVPFPATQNPFPAPPLPICPNGQQAISRCFGQGSCPTNYQCINGGCCMQQLPTCPSGVPAIQPCMGVGPTSCPVGYICLNGGCCQGTCNDGSTPIQSCPTGLCPQGFQCRNGMCCKIQLPSCPNGQLAVQSCAGTGQSTCQMGYYCLNGGCCQLPTCPNGQPAMQVCGPGGVCPGGLVCLNSGCCQPPLPTCPDNTVATRPCSGAGTCGANQYCYQQGCCNIPTCPNGQLAVEICGIQGFQCSAGYQCINGGCCPLPLPLCPNGIRANQPCTDPGNCSPQSFCFVDSSGQRGCCPIPRCNNGTPAAFPCFGNAQCPQNYVCQNGGCCPLPRCPNGQLGIQQCGRTGDANCPSGYQCQNGVCCPLPLCPNGHHPVQVCNHLGQCPSGYVCKNGGCCPIPNCPDGNPAVQSCMIGQGQGNCPAGYQCVNGGCCQIQPVPLTCPYGGNPVQACGPGNTCPAPYICYQNQCCPPPASLPVCPNGQRATQACTVGAPGGCPANYQCINGGCCPMQVQPMYPVCPQIMQAICFCASYNFICPQTTSCHSGVCCANNASPFYNTVRPGDQCSHDSECPGLSTCLNGYCVCSGNSRSNGVTCVSYKHKDKWSLYEPAKTCGQFGTECEKYDKIEKRNDGKVRRKAPTMDELGINNNTEPIFWYTFLNPDHYCSSAAECTPDMTCIENKCYSYLTPGELGCKLNEQCNRTCPGSLCVEDKIHGATMCQCEPGRLLYQKRCLKQCPAHAKAQGDTCVPIKMQKTGLKSKPITHKSKS